MKFFCEYCGCRINAEKDNKCPNCGASYKKNKTFIELEQKIKENKELNKQVKEENYKKNKKKATAITLVVLIIGILIGGSLIVTGLKKQHDVNLKYSEDNKSKLSQQLATEKQNLINSKAELEAKIRPTEDEIKSLKREQFTGFNDDYYAREDKIEELEKSISSDKNSIKVIDDALNESFNHCNFDEAKNNTYTSKYCSLKNQLKDITDFNKEFDSFDSIPFYILGTFVIIISCMISASTFSFSKHRDIVSFIKEDIEEALDEDDFEDEE